MCRVVAAQRNVRLSATQACCQISTHQHWQPCRLSPRHPSTPHLPTCPAEHQYTRASLSFQNLKGRDRQVAHALAACPVLATHAALVTRYVMGPEDEDQYDHDSDDFGYGYSDEEEEGDEMDVGEEGGGEEDEGPGGVAGPGGLGAPGAAAGGPGEGQGPSNAIEEMMEVRWWLLRRLLRLLYATICTSFCLQCTQHSTSVHVVPPPSSPLHGPVCEV
jgi:hypothetical protein